VQVQGTREDKPIMYKGMGDCFTKVVRNEGFAGIWMFVCCRVLQFRVLQCVAADKPIMHKPICTRAEPLPYKGGSQ